MISSVLASSLSGQQLIVGQVEREEGVITGHYRHGRGQRLDNFKGARCEEEMRYRQILWTLDSGQGEGIDILGFNTLWYRLLHNLNCARLY